MGDPYSLIKAEIDQELQQMTTLQAKLFAGHGEVAAELNSKLQDTAEQLQALEAAVQSMVVDPSKYGLTSAAAFGRQVEVETLRYTLTDLQETCAQAETSSSSSSSRGLQAATKAQSSSIELPTIAPPGASSSSRQHPAANGNVHNGRLHSNGGNKQPSSSIPRLPAGPPIRHSKLVQSRGGVQHPGGVSNGGSSRSPLQQPKQQPADEHSRDDTQAWGDGSISYEAIMQQQVRRQDEALDHIAISVDRIKQTGQLMHEELEEQAGLLSGLEEDTDTTHLRLRGLRKKVADVIKQSSKDRQLCLIIGLSVVLVVLTVLAIA